MFGLLFGKNLEVGHVSYRAKLRFTRHRGQIRGATWSLLHAYDGLLPKLRAETPSIVALMGGLTVFIGMNWEEDSSPLLLNDLVLGREKIGNSPCDNIEDSFAVRKQ